MRPLYLLREAMTNLLVNRGNVLIGIVTTAFTLVCFGVFVLLYLNLKNVTGTLQSDIEVIVYLDPGASEQVVSLVQKRLETEPAAVTLTFVSKEQALREFSEQFPEESLLLEGMDANPLPASVVVNLSPRFSGYRITECVCGTRQATSRCHPRGVQPGLGRYVDVGGQLL